ncbi:MAG: hypothetical protein ACLFVE_10850 [Chitinispirillaceae bacterium]
MDMTAPQGYQGAEPNQGKTSAQVIATGSLAEGIVGAGAVVLAILGLLGIFPAIMLYVATIAVGVALLFEGGAVTSRMKSLTDHNLISRSEAGDIGTGMTAEFLAGLAGTVLGILALLGIAPITLVSVAAIVYGAALVFGSGTTARVNALSFGGAQSDTAQQVARESVSSASGVQMLVGIGAGVLGILALLGNIPATLTLVAMLSIGAADLVSGGAIGSRMLSLFRR